MLLRRRRRALSLRCALRRRRRPSMNSTGWRVFRERAVVYALGTVFTFWRAVRGISSCVAARRGRRRFISAAARASRVAARRTLPHLGRALDWRRRADAIAPTKLRRRGAQDVRAAKTMGSSVSKRQTRLEGGGAIAQAKRRALNAARSRHDLRLLARRSTLAAGPTLTTLTLWPLPGVVSQTVRPHDEPAGHRVQRNVV